MKKVIRSPKAAMFFVLFFCLLLVISTQVFSGCFNAEFGDDEASHYISGLLIHDYLSSGFHISPIDYLKWYHSHYALVGIGHWGPVFYIVEALWMFLFSANRISVMLLSTVLTSVTAALVYHYGTAHLKLSRLASIFAAAAFIVCPITQAGSSAVMLDIPIALCAVLALIAYSRYLETERWIYSVLFGVVTATAMLIKGNGALLALLPPFAIVFSRKWYLIGRFSFWAPALLAGLIAGPWYFVTYGQVAAGFRYSWGMAYTRVAIVENSEILFSALGPLVILLAVIGVFAGVRRSAGISHSGFHGVTALLAAVWVFQSMAPAAIQDRYLVPLLPSLVLLAAVGGHVMVTAFQRRVAINGVGAVVFAVAAVSLLPSVLNAEVKPQQGFRDLAKLVWANRTEANPVVLIAAKESAEAAMVAELAMADPARPSLFAVRGSRFLGGGGYNRSEYLPKFSDADQVAAALDANHVPLVFYQADPGGWAHVAQVDAAHLKAKLAWQLLGTTGSSTAPAYFFKLLEANGEVANIKKWVALTGPKALEGSATLNPRQ